MLSLIEELPLELVSTNVLGYLYLKDIVLLERACGSKKSHQLYLDLIPYCTPVQLSTKQQNNREALNWFVYKRCKLSSLTIKLPGDNPCLHVKNLQVEYFDLQINSSITIESLKSLIESKTACFIRSVYIAGDQDREVMEQLSACTRNVKQLKMHYAYNCMDWLSADILAIWKLREIHLEGETVTSSFLTLIVETCLELTSIKLDSDTVDDSAVTTIAQHCSKLKSLVVYGSNEITYASLLALSEHGLPLKELDIPYVPSIPTADIARRCSHALSCIRYLDTCDLHQIDQDASILLPYMTGLTNVNLAYYSQYWIPLLTQHCHKLTKIKIHYILAGSDILPLCRANPLIQELYFYCPDNFTDNSLIELIHACPHLHILYLPYDTNITDTCILALSAHCPQLQELVVRQSHNITEVAVLQLLQRCHKLTLLDVSRSSLSEETWTQLDKNTQKRVRRR